MIKLQKYLVDTLTLSSDTKKTLGKKRLSTTAVQHMKDVCLFCLMNITRLLWSMYFDNIILIFGIHHTRFNKGIMETLIKHNHSI